MQIAGEAHKRHGHENECVIIGMAWEGVVDSARVLCCSGLDKEQCQAALAQARQKGPLHAQQ